MKKISLLLLFHCILKSVVAQTIYYVDPVNGNDANNGTSLGTAWKTIQKSCNSATPNSVVEIKGGTYKESITVNVSGSAGNPITFRSYMNESVLIDGTGITGSTLLTIKDKSFLNFEKLTFQNLTKNNAIGILVECSASATVTALRFSKLSVSTINWTNNAGTKPGSNDNSQPFIAYGRGTTAGKAITNLVVEDCEFYNNITGYSETLSLDGNIDGFIIRNNRVHDNINIGIYVGGNYGECSIPALDHVRNGTIENNTCYNNVAFYATSGGIYADGAQNVLIQRNQCFRNGYGVEVGCEENGSTDNITVVNNLIVQNKEAGISIGGYTTSTTGQVLNCRFRNNTLFKNDDSKSGSGELYITKASNCSFENNILYANDQNVLMSMENISPQSGNTFNYNCWNTPSGNASDISILWKNTAYHSFATYQSGTTQDGNSVFANPAFVNLSLPNPDLHLLTPSPCINSGNPNTTILTGELDYDGNPRKLNTIDIGAYEYQPVSGIISNETRVQTELYPNPFFQQTILLCDQELKSADLKIFSITGQLVTALHRIHGKKTEINRNDLKEGVYFYILTEAGQFLASGKFTIVN